MLAFWGISLLKIAAIIVVIEYLLAPTCVWAQSQSLTSPEPNSAVETPASSASAQPADATPTPPTTAPHVEGNGNSCGSMHYRPIAVHVGFKGVSELTFHVEPDGSVKDVSVLNSSGINVLDQTAAACAVQWHYKPATRDGQPVEVTWHAKVQWGFAGQAGQ